MNHSHAAAAAAAEQQQSSRAAEQAAGNCIRQLQRLTLTTHLSWTVAFLQKELIMCHAQVVQRALVSREVKKIELKEANVALLLLPGSVLVPSLVLLNVQRHESLIDAPLGVSLGRTV